jgi:hypothetical protein
MKKRMKMTCRTCKFAQTTSTPSGSLVVECHRNPPQMTFVPGPQGQMGSIAGWPAVRADQSCGEFRVKLVIVSELPGNG